MLLGPVDHQAEILVGLSSNFAGLEGLAPVRAQEGKVLTLFQAVLISE